MKHFFEISLNFMGINRSDCHVLTGSFAHGTIIRTGITCKTIRCYIRDPACRWLIVKNAKIF